MNIPVEILFLTSGVGALQSAFFGVYLFTLKRGRQLTSLFLGFLLLSLAIRMTKSVLYTFSEGHVVPQLLQNLGYGANLAILPLLWLYLKAFFIKDYRFHWVGEGIHLIPAVTVILLSAVITPYFWMNQHGYTYSLLLMGAYLPFCFHIVVKHFLTLNIAQRRWILCLTIGVTLVWASYMANFIFHLVPYITAPLMFTFVIYIMSFLVLRQGNIFVRETRSNSEPYSVAEIERCFEKLQHAMKEEKLFKDSQLSLPKAAKLLGVSTHLLSASINKKSGQNFSDFINSYRVEEARWMLSCPEYSHQKIAAIAFETGFNSLSAFNAAFKKITSTTPSEYRKKLKA
jgi:AraC-like DNA-binding protein